MKVVRGVLVVAILGCAIAVPQIAWACSCAGPEPSDEEAFEDYDAVFVGTARSMRFARDQGDHPDQIWRFAVDRVNRGRVYVVQAVHTPHDGGICAFPFRKGRRYQVWADERRDGTLHTALCGKSRLMNDASDAYEPTRYSPRSRSSGADLPATGLPPPPLAAAIGLFLVVVAAGTASRRLRMHR